MSINGYKVYEISKEGHVQHLIDGRRIWGKDKIIGFSLSNRISVWNCDINWTGIKR